MVEDKKKAYGFTLVEMLVVIIIIAALVLIFVPNIIKQSQRANDASRDALEQVVRNQTVLYYNEFGEYPSDITELQANDYLTSEQVEKAREYDINVRH